MEKTPAPDLQKFNNIINAVPAERIYPTDKAELIVRAAGEILDGQYYKVKIFNVTPDKQPIPDNRVRVWIKTIDGSNDLSPLYAKVRELEQAAQLETQSSPNEDAAQSDQDVSYPEPPIA